MGLGVVGVVLALACACCFGVQASWSREGDAEVASEARDRRGRARDDHQKRSAPSPKTAPRRDGERRRERESRQTSPTRPPTFPFFRDLQKSYWLLVGCGHGTEKRNVCVDRRLFLRRRKGKKASPRPGSARAEGGRRKEESGPPQQPPLLHPPLNHTSPSAGTLQALTPQISLAYSPIVRSVENLPLPAVDRIDLRAHPASSR